MSEEINKQFEEYQKQLKIREKKLKPLVAFETDEDIYKILEELKKKEILL